MDSTSLPIVIPSQPLLPGDLSQFRNNPFENVIKFAVDIEKNILALGGEMHADAESLLLENGSRQEAIWGGNLWPWENPILIETISLINIRPSQNNRGMEIEDETIKKTIQTIVYHWIKLWS